MTKPIVLLLHGPNLNLLGTREPEIYGSATLSDHVGSSRLLCVELGLELEDFQSNSESALIDAIHNARNRCAAIVINPGAFTHYSWAIHDALAMFNNPIIELHLTNPERREAWRHTSVISPVATGSIVGLGAVGYEMAIRSVNRLIS